MPWDGRCDGAPEQAANRLSAKPPDGSAKGCQYAKDWKPSQCHLDHKTKIAWLERRLSESLEQQAATSDVLQIISSTQTSVTAVLDAVTANAVRLCKALNATIYLRDGDAVVIHAGHRRHSPGTGKFDLGACLLTTRRSRAS